MKMNTRNKKLRSLLLCMMLIVAMAFCTTACNGNQEAGKTEIGKNSQEAGDDANLDDASMDETNDQETITVLGEGSTKFNFAVIDKDGNETLFEIHTDKETVGDALMELNLISGDEGAYGLYVKTVNGITADYDVDQTYWAFYINGEYAMTGVDATNVAEGDSYSFKVEK